MATGKICYSSRSLFSLWFSRLLCLKHATPFLSVLLGFNKCILIRKMLKRLHVAFLSKIWQLPLVGRGTRGMKKKIYIYIKSKAFFMWLLTSGKKIALLSISAILKKKKGGWILFYAPYILALMNYFSWRSSKNRILIYVIKKLFSRLSKP